MARTKDFDKDTVLVKAMHIFSEKGYEATSVRDLLACMGISSSSMYETFGDKRAVYLEALALFRQQEYAAFQQQITSAQSARQLVQELFYMLAPEQNAAHGSLSLNAILEFGTRDPDVTAQLMTHFNDMADLLTRFFTEAQYRDEISGRHEPRALAQTILNALYGVFTLSRVQHNTRQITDIARIHLTLLD